MNDATATSALEGFSPALNRMPLAMHKSMTYDQGREMARHAEITQKTGVAICFFDRTALGNVAATRQYLPKGTDLSVYSQEELDAIALQCMMLQLQFNNRVALSFCNRHEYCREALC